MTYNSKTKQYVYDYKAEKIKRIPLDVQTSFYDEIKAAADQAGEPVNSYIKEAIRQRMERCSLQAADPVPAAAADPVQAYPVGDIAPSGVGGVTCVNTEK